jgi:hypothetical protein
MSIFKTTGALGIMMVALIAAALGVPASAAPGGSGEFAPANWPEETIYRPECRVLQSDGSWLPCLAVEGDWRQSRGRGW